MQIIIERHPNVEVTTFHVNRRLTESGSTLRFRSDNGVVKLESRYGAASFDIEPLAQQIAEEIYKIPGVFSDPLSSGVSITMHRVHVAHSRAYDENDVEFSVIEVLARLLHVDLDSVNFSLDDYSRTREYRRRMRQEEAMYNDAF